MGITDVSVSLFAWNGIPATRYACHTGHFKGSSTLGLVTVHTDDGVDGHAFLGSASNGADREGPIVTKVLKPMLIGEDPLDRARLYDDLMSCSRYAPLRTIGALDIALWDIGGKVAGLPVHRLLASFRDSVPAYASSTVLGSPEAYAEEALAHREAGWTAYKIHPPAKRQTDIKVCEATREAVGDYYTLMLDSA